MDNQSRLELCKKIAEEKNGKCLSVKYVNVMEKMEWQCVAEHKWLTAFRNIKSGSWCPECKGLKKLTLEDCKESAKLKNGERLSKKYININEPMEWRCELGHIWKTTAKSVREGHWCVVCSGYGPVSLKDCQNYAESKNGKCLSTEYVDSRHPMEWQCELGHTWISSYRMKYDNNWCAQCAGNKKLTLEVCKSYAESKGGECLSTEYVNTYNTLMKWKCSKNHIWEIRFSDIRNDGHWCSECAYDGMKLTLEECKEHAKTKKGECLSEKYNNNYEKLLWKCEKGHQWNACFSNIKHLDQWCPSCLYKNETKCREIFEKIYGKPFPKRRGILSNPYMELDGYNEELKIAFEFQGKQHYEFVEHFHRNGLEDLENQKKRDQQKRLDCEKLGIRLIEIPHYTENIENFLTNLCN